MPNNHFKGNFKKPIRNRFSATQLHILLYDSVIVLLSYLRLYCDHKKFVP